MMLAPAFTKFNPRAFLQNDEQNGTTAKVAKVAKVQERLTGSSAALASLATFAAGPAENQNFDSSTDKWAETQEERAAIAEHDGGAPRAWSEALARLDPCESPGGVPPRRWLQFLDDCGHFLDQGWAQRCAALGWGPLDLFGCDRERPFGRIDHQGLLWLLDGNKIVELHRDKAIIEMKTGARQTYRRRPVEVGRVVLAWELAS
jgi:hypothetical protein